MTSAPQSAGRVAESDADVDLMRTRALPSSMCSTVDGLTASIAQPHRRTSRPAPAAAEPPTEGSTRKFACRRHTSADEGHVFLSNSVDQLCIRETVSVQGPTLEGLRKTESWEPTYVHRNERTAYDHSDMI